MSHALIIDDNVILSRAIRNRLESFGFDSFDYTWAEEQAIQAATERRPDLIVVGDAIVEGSPIGVAGKLAACIVKPRANSSRHSAKLHVPAPSD